MVELQKAEQELSFAQKQLDEVKALHDIALNEKQVSTMLIYLAQHSIV